MKSLRISRRKSVPYHSAILAAVLLSSGLGFQARAQSTWSGAGADTGLGTAGNWVGGTAPTFGGAELSTNQTSLIFNNAVNVNVNMGTGTRRGVKNITFTGAGVGAFTFTNTGRWVLTLGGKILMDADVTNTVNIGRLGFGTNSVASSSYTIENNATLSTATLQMVSFATAAANMQTVVLTGSNTGTNIFQGASGNIALQKDGEGRWDFSSITTTGGAIVNSGTVGLRGNNALGGGLLTINGGTIASFFAARSLSNNILVGGNFTLGGLGQSVTFTGNIDLGGATRTITLGNSVTFGGVISNGGLTLDSTSSSRTLILTDASTYTGGTTIEGGELALTGAGSLASGGAVNVSAGTTGATLTISGITASSLEIASLAGGASGTVALGDKNLLISGNGASNNYAGTITGTGGLVKSGTGTLVLQGTSTFEGGVTLESGTLGVRTSAGALGTGTLTINGGTLASVIVPRTVANNISVGGDFALGGLANTITLGGAIDLNGQLRTITLNNSATVSGVISNGSLLLDNPDATRFLELTAANTFTNATVNGGILRLSGSGSFQSSGAVDLEGSRGAATFDITGITAGAATIGSLTGAANAAVLLGGKELAVGGNDGSATFAGDISGAAQATLRKTGTGTLELSGENTLAGELIVDAGTVRLNKAGSAAASAISSLSVGSGASLLISQSDQVNNAATVSLSGGTIVRGAGVSEVFGALSLTGSGFLDFGTGVTGTLSFGTYAPSSLLTVQNFFPGNKLTFTSNLTDDIGNTGLFSFQGDFNSDWDGSTFTITAIPEPSTYVAMAGLLALFLWPSRRRLLKDARSILGLHAPTRDRLAARS